MTPVWHMPQTNKFYILFCDSNMFKQPIIDCKVCILPPSNKIFKFTQYVICLPLQIVEGLALYKHVDERVLVPPPQEIVQGKDSLHNDQVGHDGACMVLLLCG